MGHIRYGLFAAKSATGLLVADAGAVVTARQSRRPLLAVTGEAR